MNAHICGGPATAPAAAAPAAEVVHLKNDAAAAAVTANCDWKL